MSSRDSETSLGTDWGSYANNEGDKRKIGGFTNLRKKLSMRVAKSVDFGDLQRELGEANEKIEAVVDQNRSLQVQVETAMGEKDKLMVDVSNSMKTINNLSSCLEEHKRDLKIMNEDKKALQEELASSHDRVLDVLQENEDLRNQANDCVGSVEILRIELMQLREKTRQLAKEKEDLEASLTNAKRPLIGFGRRTKSQQLSASEPLHNLAGELSRSSSSPEEKEDLDASPTSQTQWHKQFCGLGKEELAQ